MTGNMFKLAGKKGLSIPKLLEFLLTDEFCSTMIQSNYSFEWCDDGFMLDTVIHEYKNRFKKTFPKSKKKYDDFLLWYGGYLYKYWIDYKDLKPEELYTILNILPWNEYIKGFAFYHTQDWRYVVEDAIDTYNRNKK
jgi:hypothetical protein